MDPDRTIKTDLYRWYELRHLDPDSVRSKLESGQVALSFFGTDYNLTVQQVPWNPELNFTNHGDHTTSESSSSNATVAYNGTGELADGTPFRGLVIVTDAGVGGEITVGNETSPTKNIVFDPAKFFSPSAPTDVSLAYRLQDRKDLNITFSSPPGNSSTNETATASSSGVEDQHIGFWVDNEMTDNVEWKAKVETIYSRVNDAYEQMLGFQFTGGDEAVWDCQTDSCNQDNNLTSSVAGVLLEEWAWKAKEQRETTFHHDFEIAAALTGKNLEDISGDSDVAGAAYQPGRYVVSEAEPHTYFAARILGHELGHSFNGDHGRRGASSLPDDCPEDDHTSDGGDGRARCEWHEHASKKKHCHLPPNGIYELVKDLTGLDLCLDPHYHEQTDEWHKHYTMMWGRDTRGGSWKFDLSDTNNDPAGDHKNDWYMTECNKDWDGGSFKPDNYDGFGTECKS